MKRFLSAFFLLAGAAAVASAQVPALQEARQRWLHGNYDEAREQYEALLKDDKLKAAAAVGLSRSLESLGEYDKALDVVATALQDSPKDADLLARHAEILYLRGRWEEAEKQATAALAVNANHFLARWIQAQVWRDRGDLDKADAACRWFVRTYSDRSDKDDDIKDPDELLIVGMAGAENARWKSLSDQFQFILDEVYKDALKADKAFWPAEYQAGLLLLEKYNEPKAREALDKALAINPSSAEALAAKGVLALRRYRLQEAERLAEQSLKINPRLPEALRLRADVHLLASDPDAALRELETAREVNPRDERTLARIACCLFLQKKQAEYDALAETVKKFDPKPAVYWGDLGEVLRQRHWFDEAEKALREAVRVRPNMPGPANDLGQLLMDMGREKEAREFLDKGFANDPFNVRVGNLRKVLHHLDKYETRQTDHFELRFDPKVDAVQARYMAEYLEGIHAALVKKFNFTPPGRILLEVLTSHEMFSGRVIALPDLPTYAACSGRIIALASPHAKDLPHPFNWARALRHEIVHVFNLEQTHFQVPVWLTEGLAVSNEGFRRPLAWNELLCAWAAAGKLMNLDAMEHGFRRPSNPNEWQMAYCHSQILIDYIQTKFGQDAIGGLLAAYGEGLTTPKVIRQVCKMDKAEFEKGFLAHVEEVVKGLRKGKTPPKPRSAKELQQAFEKDNDVDAGAELALRLLDRDRVQARKLAEQVLGIKKGQATAIYVLARLAHIAGNEDEERTRLESIADKASEPRVLRALGKIYYDAEEYSKAEEMFKLGREAEPNSSEWLAQLARVYGKANDKKKLIAVLEDWLPSDPDELEQRVRLAGLLLEVGRAADAERVAREALEIDVLSDEARELLLKALGEQKKDEAAQKVRELLQKK
jgi:tetratricopeptide (TPR) repeat protein